ncbi:MAG: 3'-5' exonuclease [Candidatus Pacebacteria bacterium]|nr:3'-5' exonuclease [Candidatus Paceibacterota bacterium]
MSLIHEEIVLSSGIMVDVETAGPIIGIHALLSIGGCVVAHPEARFYVELKPDRTAYVQEALDVCKLDLTVLQRTGQTPATALPAFVAWVREQYTQPLFVAHNAAFDWMFVQFYLGAYGVHNSFGYKPLCTWSAYGPIMKTSLPHHAGKDAYLQTIDLRRHYGLE